MLISYTHNFIFIKTRKVGGTSLEKYIIDHHFDKERDKCTGSKVDNIPWYNLPESTKGHMPWTEIKSLEPEADIFKVWTIDRNPWDKCVSQYFFFRDKIKTIPKEMTFSQFLKNPSNLPVDNPRYNNAENCIVIKWEEMDTDLPVIFERLGLELDMDKFKGYNLKSGIRKDNHYSEMYNDDDLEIVRDAFKWEIENLVYEFADHR